MTFGERIKMIRASQTPKMTQTTFGEKIGVSKDVIANLEYDRVNPSESMIRLISKTYNISYAWLKTGEGEMEPEPIEDDTPGKLMARYRSGSPSVRTLLRVMAELDDGWYDQLDAVLRRLEAQAAQDEEDEEGSSE